MVDFIPVHHEKVNGFFMESSFLSILENRDVVITILLKSIKVEVFICILSVRKLD